MYLLNAHEDRARRTAPYRHVAFAIVTVALAPIAARAGAAEADSKSAPQRLSVSAQDPDSAARLLDVGAESATPIMEATRGREQTSAAESPAPIPATESAADIEPKPIAAPTSPPARETIIEQPAAQSAPRPRFDRVEPIKAEAAHFNGVQPGGSTRADVREKWGSPKEIKKIGDETRYLYSIEPFEQVAVAIENDRVAGIAIFLGKAVESQALAHQLRLDDCQAVVVADEKDKPVGEVYPEHGVMFAYASPLDVGQVIQIVIEPIDAQAFLVRAEERLKEEFPAHALADARFAAELEPKSAVAQALAARALGQLGRPVAGRAAAEEAMRLDPKNRDYRFLAARLEIDAGDPAAAARLVRRILTQQPLPPLVEARAYEMLGDCFAQPGDKNFSQAIEHHQHTIRLVEPLAADSSPQTRRAAKMLLLEAHLAVARDIALGQWSHKHQAAMKWLGRAKTMAEELTTKEQADAIVLLEVHETAMMVLAAAPGKSPATDWIAELKRIGDARIDAAEEVEARGSLQWRLALALADAMVIERTGGKTADSLALGETAAKLIAEADATIDTPDRDPRRAIVLPLGVAPGHRASQSSRGGRLVRQSPAADRSGGQGQAEPVYRSGPNRRYVGEHGGFLLGDRRPRASGATLAARGQSDRTSGRSRHASPGRAGGALWQSLLDAAPARRCRAGRPLCRTSRPRRTNHRDQMNRAWSR